jgi:hypothetical protein
MWPLQIVVMLTMVSFVISFVGGWWSLGLEFASDLKLPRGSFTGSGSLRWIAGYNNVLRFGADREYLYLRCWLRIAHPPLAIPWTQIEVRAPRRLLFSRSQTLVLGLGTRIPLTLREKDVVRLLRLRGVEPPPFAGKR